MCEGALYEPWNQATLDKLSSEGILFFLNILFLTIFVYFFYFFI